MYLRFLFLFLILSPTTLFAQTVHGDKNTNISDPLESLNRVIWDFNYKVLDPNLIKPVTESYVDWIPLRGRTAINNFVQNLNEPATVINNLLQFKFKKSAESLTRFTINSTLGFFGLFDIAALDGLERSRQSFGNALSYWNLTEDPYIMLPVAGSSSVNRLIGVVVDDLYFPMNYISFAQHVVIWGFEGLDARANLLGKEPLLEQSLDSYAFVKNVYIQNEAFKLHSQSSDLKPFYDQDLIDKNGKGVDLDSFMDEID